MSRIVAFGEVMLRLSPPGRELVMQSPRFDVWTAGAEANVATALALLGHDAALASVLPEGPLGDAALRALRGHGVDCRPIARRAGRMGLYFVVNGAGQRASDVIYDRAGSAFAETPREAWDWDGILAGADRLHLSGITPALGPHGTRAALDAVHAAERLRVPVSFDGNFRARLWSAWEGDPAGTLRAIVAKADILFGDHRDIGLMLGDDAFAPGRDAAQAAFAAFPRLALVAATRRTVEHVGQHRIAGQIHMRDGTVAETPEALVADVVDRVGTGDAFAAGVIDGLARGLGAQTALDRGLALAILKHSLPGDAALFDAAAIDQLLVGGLDVRR